LSLIYFYRTSVHFTVGSAEETARQGHLKVIAKHLYQQDGKRTPVSHGVLDRKLGTCSKDAKCTTCKNI
jgi:DNA-directed RNA polymerase III subunit RPC1